MLKRTSSDGVHWSPRTIIADLRKQEDIDIWGEQIISQAIIWTGKEYLCWYVDASSYVPIRHINVCSSKDGLVWNRFKRCELAGENINPWHIDVQRIEGHYIMLCYQSEPEKIVCFESLDGLSFSWKSDVIAPSHKKYDFFRDGIYRACLVKTDDLFRIYFSAKRGAKSAIGLLASEDLHSFHFMNGQSPLRYLGLRSWIGYWLGKRIR